MGQLQGQGYVIWLQRMAWQCSPYAHVEIVLTLQQHPCHQHRTSVQSSVQGLRSRAVTLQPRTSNAFCLFGCGCDTSDLSVEYMSAQRQPPTKRAVVCAVSCCAVVCVGCSMTTGAQQALRRTMEIYSNTTRFALACNTSTKVHTQPQTARHSLKPSVKHSQHLLFIK